MSVADSAQVLNPHEKDQSALQPRANINTQVTASTAAAAHFSFFDPDVQDALRKCERGKVFVLGTDVLLPQPPFIKGKFADAFHGVSGHDVGGARQQALCRQAPPLSCRGLPARDFPMIKSSVSHDQVMTLMT